MPMGSRPQAVILKYIGFELLKMEKYKNGYDQSILTGDLKSSMGHKISKWHHCPKTYGLSHNHVLLYGKLTKIGSKFVHQ